MVPSIPVLKAVPSHDPGLVIAHERPVIVAVPVAEDLGRTEWGDIEVIEVHFAREAAWTPVDMAVH